MSKLVNEQREKTKFTENSIVERGTVESEFQFDRIAECVARRVKQGLDLFLIESRLPSEMTDQEY